MLLGYFFVDLQKTRNHIFVPQYETAEGALQSDQGSPGGRGDLEQTVGGRAWRNGTHRFDLVHKHKTTFPGNLVFDCRLFEGRCTGAAGGEREVAEKAN